MAIATSIGKFLELVKVPYTTFTHRAAFTAQEEAAAAHVPGRHWAKTVICLVDDEPVQAVLPAHMTVDLEKLRTLAGGGVLRLATEPEIAKLYPECEPGAMPPFGPLYKQRVFVDKSLMGDPEMVFNAGTHTDAIRMRYSDFETITKPIVGSFVQPPRH